MKPGTIIIIAGPTASGKSSLALDVAQKTDGVIINADSQQVYEGLSILTARPAEEDEARAPHRLYGFLPPHEACSAGKWLRFAEMEIDWVLGEGKTPIVTGGTGLYIKALLEGIAEIPDIDEAVRNQARSDLKAMGNEAFHERLAAVDTELAARLNPNDSQRILRGYEVWLGTGKPLTYWHNKSEKPKYESSLFCIIKLEHEREYLYSRCDERARLMFEEGAIEEVRDLLSRNLDPDLPAMRIIGVPEIGAMLAGKISENEALEKLQQATRNYAKRQLTWLRNQLSADFTLPADSDLMKKQILS